MDFKTSTPEISERLRRAIRMGEYNSKEEKDVAKVYVTDNPNDKNYLAPNELEVGP
jgi:hypothetical protein